MRYPKEDIRLIGEVSQVNEERMPLQIQHMNHILIREQNRAALTQYAMNNTAILMERAVAIMDENPESAGALKEIMNAYLDATGECIRSYGRPWLKRR